MRDRINIDEAYSILELKPGASQAEVKQAYRKLVKIWHPDRFPSPEQKQAAEEKIKLINEAYNKLKFYQPDTVKKTYQTAQTYQKKQTKIYANRSNAETFYNWGVENAKSGRYEEALSDFSHAIRLNPNYIEAYKHRGFVCSVLGYENRAASDLNKAAQLEGSFKNQQRHSTASASRKSTPSRWKSKWKSLIERFFHWIKCLLGFNRRYR